MCCCATLIHSDAITMRKLEGGKPYPDLVDQVLPCHDQWDEDAMAEGSPGRARLTRRTG